MIRRRRSSFDPFTDLLFNALLGFTFLFMIAVMFINPITRLGAVNLKLSTSLRSLGRQVRPTI